MLKTFLITLVFGFAGIMAVNTAFAQSAADSTDNGHALYANVESNFYKVIGNQSRLYNGERYDNYDPAWKGSAYLMDSAGFTHGTVVYDGYTYKNLNMVFDIYKDELIILLYNNFLKMSLISEKVTSFDLLGHHFIYIKAGAPAINPVKPGFYDQLYGGNISVLCKRGKNLQTVQNFTGNFDTYFISSSDYYIFKNGEYFTVNSKGSFLDVLKDKKKSLQQFIRVNKLKFKKDTKEQDMAKIADYYDHLAN